MIDRVPPHNLEAERAVLGALMLSPESHWKVKGVLGANDWYREAHAHIAQAILEGGGDISKVIQNLRDAGALGRGCDADYVANLAAGVNNLSLLDGNIQTVKECAQRRELIFLCYQEAEAAYTRASEETAGALRRRLGEIETQDRIKIVSASESVNEAFKEIEKASKHDGTVIGVSSGFSELDWHTGGFRPGDVIVLGARPGMGKTVFASNMAVKCGKPALIFNLEMTARQLSTRDLAGVGKLSLTKLRTGRLKEQDWARLVKAAGKISELPIYYVDTGNVTVEEIAGITEKAVRRHGVELLIIDYIQLVGGQKEKKREEFVAHISRSVKNLARELQIPVVVLAQLNRQCEQRANKRPLLSDLRESGAIEQDADVVLFLFRESVYDKTKDKHEAELIISKGRNIQIGTIKLRWDGEFQLFQNQYHV